MSSYNTQRTACCLELISLPSDQYLHKSSLKELGQLYMTWCHNQPLPLFSREGFANSLSKRDSELILSLRALTGRFPPGALTTSTHEKLILMATEAKESVMKRVAEGRIRLSTLQTLCVLSIIDFTGERRFLYLHIARADMRVEGKAVQAQVSLGIARNLAQSVPQGCALGDMTEWKDCTTSIRMLQDLHGSLSSPETSLSGSTRLRNPPGPRNGSLEGESDRGIMKFTESLAQVWNMARGYAKSCPTHDILPPWDPRSDYSRVMQFHLEIDCGIPMAYRYATNNISSEDPATRHRRRAYWGPWFFTQFVYATVACLVNHPFLLSMRLRNFRYTIPQAFIEQCFDAISRHSRWVIYFIDMLDELSYQIVDPVLAHCVVVMATVHLQHSFVENSPLRQKAQLGFDKCMGFLRRMATIWPSVSHMVRTLELPHNYIQSSSFWLTDE